MQFARLKFNGNELELERDVTTIGRTPDNDVSFAGDSNVSRYHAEIERRDVEYYLIDPGSSNGTTVNGTRVDGEVRLKGGDKILLGGSSEIEFVTDAPAAADAPNSDTSGGSGLSDAPGVSELQSEVGGVGNQAEYAADSAIREAIDGSISDAIAGGTGGEAASATAVASSGSNPVVLVAGAVCGVAVVAVLAAGAIYYSRGSSQCTATAKIVRPEPGDTITKPADIAIDVTDGGCVKKAVVTIDGKDVASADPPGYSMAIDPKDVPELADGDVHTMEVVLIDETGTRLAPAGGVMLAFETKVATRSPTPVVVTQGSPQQTRPAETGSVSLIQVQQMSQDLLKKFSGNFAYNLSNKQFIQEVQKRTGEYVSEGYSARAAAYRDVINVAFVREQNIDAPLGYYLAMSRSRFDPSKKGDAEGLWQMTNAFVTDNKYNGTCGTETLSDPTQNCAAKAAALYMKSIVFGVFDGDPLYSAAAFGKTPGEAAIWKATLPANRSDVWNTIRTAPEREQLVRFFAAGIVAENPQRFGLTKDRPLSELYRVAM